MTRFNPDVLEAARLPALCRGVCLYAGLPLPPVAPRTARFVVRSGTEPPELLAKLLEEAFVDDGIEVQSLPEDDSPEPGGSRRVVVRGGFTAPCPVADELRRAAAPDGGPVLLFAVERYDGSGR